MLRILATTLIEICAFDQFSGHFWPPRRRNFGLTDDRLTSSTRAVMTTEVEYAIVVGLAAFARAPRPRRKELRDRRSNLQEFVSCRASKLVTDVDDAAGP